MLENISGAWNCHTLRRLHACVYVHVRACVRVCVRPRASVCLRVRMCARMHECVRGRERGGRGCTVSIGRKDGVEVGVRQICDHHPSS